VFDVHAVPAADYALSLGLVGQPVIKFKKKTDKSAKRRSAATVDDDANDELLRAYKEKEAAEAARPWRCIGRIDVDCRRRRCRCS
jgi:hypothetical protein